MRHFNIFQLCKYSIHFDPQVKEHTLEHCLNLKSLAKDDPEISGTLSYSFETSLYAYSILPSE